MSEELKNQENEQVEEIKIEVAKLSDEQAQEIEPRDTEHKTNEPLQPSEKKKRGRPAKNKTTDKQPSTKPEKKKENSEITDFFKEFNGIEPTEISEETPSPEPIKPKGRRGRPKGSTAARTKKAQEPEEFKLTGQMLLSGINFALPLIAKLGYGFIDERAKKVDSEKLRLTKSEKAELQDSAEHVATEMIGSVNPLLVFLGSLFFIVGEKMSEEVSKIPKPLKVKK